ncbi:MAG TPA: TadE/TadG family type IV pilus assembly protein [Stellaceae bacterium]|jgi:Flp pilus assembly protein TadG|nr:TadE/TadG family type IV pilus assembly protein [Stellaceae bacterium]
MKPLWPADAGPRMSGKVRGGNAAARSRAARRHGLLRDSRGVAGLEFAMIAPIFLILILAVMENGLTLWQQSVLDNATRDAARLTLTGQSQNGGTGFAARLCAEISGLMNCGSLQYRIQTGSTFAGISPTISNSLSGFSTYPTAITGTSLGGPGTDVLVQVVYTRSYIVPWVGHMMSASDAERLIATAAFQNEPY